MVHTVTAAASLPVDAAEPEIATYNYETTYLVVGDVEVPSSLRIDVLEPEDMAPASEFCILCKVSKKLPILDGVHRLPSSNHPSFSSLRAFFWARAVSSPHLSACYSAFVFLGSL